MSRFKMSEAKFQAMKALFAKGMTRRQVAEAFDCGRTTVEVVGRSENVEEYREIRAKWQNDWKERQAKKQQLPIQQDASITILGESDEKKIDKVALLEVLAEILDVKITIEDEE